MLRGGIGERKSANVWLLNLENFRGLGGIALLHQLRVQFSTNTPPDGRVSTASWLRPSY